VQRLGDAVGDGAAVDVGQELADVGHAEPAEGDVADVPAALEVDQQGGGPAAGAQLFGPVGADEEGGQPRRGGQAPEGGERLGVGPGEVVDDDERAGAPAHQVAHVVDGGDELLVGARRGRGDRRGRRPPPRLGCAGRRPQRAASTR
jgi:hypothetical protein